MTNYKQIVFCFLACSLAVFSSVWAVSLQQKTRPPAAAAGAGSGPAPAEDISGMYTFLKEGEFVQINIDANGVSGYISRQGDLESDRGAFLDQFFSQASVHGHDVAFTTKPVHGVWFEFKGRFDRGPAKTKKEEPKTVEERREKLIGFVFASFLRGGHVPNLPLKSQPPGIRNVAAARAFPSPGALKPDLQ